MPGSKRPDGLAETKGVNPSVSDKLDGKGSGPHDLWSHVFVSLCACVLTVSIVGSVVFLVWRVHDRRQLKARIKTFVSSLEDRTPEELAARANRLKAHQKVARFVLPELSKSIAGAGSEQQQWSAIEVSRAFLSDKKVQKTLMGLRGDLRERIAAAAVRALGESDPPEHAVELMGQCLADARTGAAIDEACAALYRLGAVGLKEMNKRLSDLPVGRRIWLVGYVDWIGGPARHGWMTMLAADNDAAVRSAAAEALDRLAVGPSVSTGQRVESPAPLNR